MSTNLISKTSSRPGLNWVAALSVLALLVAGISQLSLAQKSGPETFRPRGKRAALSSRLSKIVTRRLWKGSSEQARK